MITKTCTKCGENFPTTAEYFHRDKYRKDGFRSDCKECWRSYQKTKAGKEVHCRAKQHYRHTLSGHLRDLYHGMVRRCTKPYCKSYRDYGGRGIKCNFESAKNFVDYVVNVLNIESFDQIKDLEIDRIDNDGHYESGNIRFIDKKENARNKNRRIK